MEQTITEKALDIIIDEMIDVVENSKNEIFEISEEARVEHDNLLAELKETKIQVTEHIKEGDQLEKKVQHSRRRLSVVNRDFNKYSEKEIQSVYETTHHMQTELAILRKREETLRRRRDDLERRLVALSQTVERASRLANKISVILTYLYDDFKNVNSVLEEAKERHEFSLQIIEAQEEERRKISREIHDGPAQMLANILLRSELIDTSFRKGRVDEALDEIKSLRKTIRSSLQEVRRIIYDLRPMALDDLGLIPTIKKYVATLTEHKNIAIEFVSVGQEKRLYQKYEIALFRLIQEALQNAINHADATLIKVKIEIRDDSISAIIEDDGHGFDIDIKRENSFGIIGMKERVEMLEGKIRINSEIGVGTKIYITTPYKNIST